RNYLHRRPESLRDSGNGGMIRKFFSTPKGLLIIILTMLATLSATGEGFRRVAPGMLSAVVAAALIDIFVLRWKNAEWTIPDGAILTGMFVAMVLSPLVQWYAVACTAAIAVISKHLLRTRSANVFNPAALGIVSTFYIFNTAQNWWGALPDLRPIALVVLFATGIFI